MNSPAAFEKLALAPSVRDGIQDPSRKRDLSRIQCRKSSGTLIGIPFTAAARTLARSETSSPCACAAEMISGAVKDGARRRRLRCSAVPQPLLLRPTDEGGADHLSELRTFDALAEAEAALQEISRHEVRASDEIKAGLWRP